MGDLRLRPLSQRPAAMLHDGFVYGVHGAASGGEGGDGLLVVAEVFVGEGAAPAVFEPLLADLVAADVELPHLRRDALEILGGVDPEATRPLPRPLPQLTLGEGSQNRGAIATMVAQSLPS
ncbi:MAG: hypothetical protein ACREP9_00685 [Candidatus Dormibacteraceae bacterium]